MHEFFYYSAEAEEYLRDALISCDIRKLELLGENYIFDLANKKIRESVRDNYITDIMKLMLTVNGRICGAEIDIPRYYDIVHSTSESKDDRTAEEIVDDVLGRAGIKIVGGEED